MRDFFQLLVEHGGGLFVGHGKASSINYQMVKIDQVVIIKYHGRPTLSRTRYKKKQDKYVLPDTFYFKYPFLDTVWCNTDRNRLEMLHFKTISAYLGIAYTSKS